MPLTPYDVLRLTRGLDMGTEQFFEEFAIAGCYPDTGFPLLHLRMREDHPERLCPFVTEQGCGVYEHRSSACRTYPLGRAARLAEENAARNGPAVIQQYFLVREEHCRGFEEQTPWTVETWLRDQELEPYNRMNDRYMELIARYKTTSGGTLLSGQQATLALLCLYQQDRFLEFFRAMNVLSRVRLRGTYEGEDAPACAARLAADPEARLAFAFDWMELVLCGACKNLAPV
jgi:Fe-S-cluster containining protein